MASASSARRIRILLIEDSPSDQELTREAFAMANVPTDLAVVEDGAAALDYLYRRGQHTAAGRPDIVLLDLNLPGIPGREVLATVKADTALKTIPVIVLTTSDDERDVLRSYGSHANCYVTKPVDFRKFVGAVRKLESFWLLTAELPPNRD